jgi:hypothetical protein
MYTWESVDKVGRFSQETWSWIDEHFAMENVWCLFKVLSHFHPFLIAVHRLFFSFLSVILCWLRYTLWWFSSQSLPARTIGGFIIELLCTVYYLSISSRTNQSEWLSIFNEMYLEWLLSPYDGLDTELLRPVVSIFQFNDPTGCSLVSYGKTGVRTESRGLNKIMLILRSWW